MLPWKSKNDDHYYMQIIQDKYILPILRVIHEIHLEHIFEDLIYPLSLSICLDMIVKLKFNLVPMDSCIKFLNSYMNLLSLCYIII